MNTAENRSALIVIDMQYDFCSGGSLAVPGAEEIIEPINGYMREFSCIAATQDWHPQGHFSFASSHTGKEIFDTVPFHDDKQILWPDHCVAGSPGAAFHDGVETDRFSMIIRKGTNAGIDSYSGFYENDHTTSTGLAGYLWELKVEHLYLCGLAADVCVYFTAVDTRKLGFKVTLLTDAARGIDTPPGSLEQRYASLEGLGVILR